ncbi:hypothetical protein QAD02_010701 [Eretmocerus hayati]|uniref:Uncharacterized protein n=1 Tax=Eretmocerus hayati TaxID=131215 RepID=A0ACC2NUQ4_9HYME|nr:hypothetical protein QAD02_010701 [Eretmocerus hayati]
MVLNVVSESQSNIQNKAAVRGRKRTRHEDHWKENMRKKLRNEGAEYTSTSGKVIPQKLFGAVLFCCAKECFKYVPETHQRGCFQSFWTAAANYNCQNYMLSKYMLMKVACSRIWWDYIFSFGTFHIGVCQKFLCNLLQIKQGRLATVQHKLKNNIPLKDFRGNHDGRKVKLSDELKLLIQEHCESMDHSTSHYTSSSLKYFDDPELNLKKLYESFLEHHEKVTNRSEIPIDLSTYSKHFNHNLNFSFSLPRTDVCNDCFESEKSTTLSPAIVLHKSNVEKHKALKKLMMTDKDALCMEFDFGQNLPVPKLPVNEQFYKRLLWLHVLNVNILNDDSPSYMYFFMEGSSKKGGNAVCNFLLDAVSREMMRAYHSKYFLFSDSCGGQNKNYLVLHFLCLLAQTFQIEFHQLFPVRGHSYCSCDRNFGVYGNKKKHMEKIETAEEYYKLVEEARNPPFTIIKEGDIRIADFESVMEKKGNMSKDLHIRDAVKISYFPNGLVQIFDEYDGASRDYRLELGVSLDDLRDAESAPPIGISKEKKKRCTKKVAEAKKKERQKKVKGPKEETQGVEKRRLKKKLEQEPKGKVKRTVKKNVTHTAEKKSQQQPKKNSKRKIAKKSEVK